MEIHHLIVVIGPVAHLDLARIKKQPGIKVYSVDELDPHFQIDMALLDDLHCYRTTVFVGGQEARREAQAYRVAWIEDTPSVNDNLFEFLRKTTPVPDCP